ncbi:MAG: hypothetical protein JSS81_26975 [Acidobacteria bacterium]|nr:hypothetical protein [Acidobacteriota bacterium]
MKVEFKKVADRRYAVRILRDGGPVLEMNPAPGFDELMPHDLCHLIVEQVLRIENAIFGQAAKGAGTFQIQPSESSNTRNDSRRRRKVRRKGKDSVRRHHEDYLRSERAAYVCWQHWLAESSEAALKDRAAGMRKNADSVFDQMPAAERALYTKENLERVGRRMDELSARWQSLKTGESMTVDWQLPDEAV